MSGVWGVSDKMLTLLTLGSLEQKTKKIITIIKLIKSFLNPWLIPSQRDKNLPYLIKKHVWEYKTWYKWSSSKSPSIQVLHQPIRGVGVLSLCWQRWRRGGVQNYEKRADIILECSLISLTLGSGNKIFFIFRDRQGQAAGIVNRQVKGRTPFLMIFWPSCNF